MTGSKRYNRYYSESSLTFAYVFVFFGAESVFCRPVFLDASSHQLNPVLEMSRSSQLVYQSFVLFFLCSNIATETLVPKV